MSNAVQTTPEIDERRGTLGSRILSMVTARLLAVAEGEGLDGDSLLQQARLSREELSCADRYLPIERHVALGDAISAALGPVNGGLHSGMAIFGDPRGGLGYAIRRSRCHARAVRRFCGFLAVANQSLRTRLSGPEAGPLVLELELARGLKRQGHPAEALFAAWVAISRFVTSKDWAPARVSFTHAPRGPISEHAEFFRCPVDFDAPATTLTIPGAALRDAIDAIEHPLDDIFARLEAQLLDQGCQPAAVNALLGEARSGCVEAGSAVDPAVVLQAARVLTGAGFRLPSFEVAFLLGFADVESLERDLASPST